MALIFIEREGETFSMFCETGDTVEWDAQMIHLTPTTAMLEQIDVKELMKLVDRGGAELAKSLGVNPKKTFITAQLVAYWSDVRLNKAATEDQKEKNEKKDKSADPLNKYTKIQLIQKAGELKVSCTLNGRKIDTRSKNEDIVEAIRRVQPLVDDSGFIDEVTNTTNTTNITNTTNTKAMPVQPPAAVPEVEGTTVQEVEETTVEAVEVVEGMQISVRLPEGKIIKIDVNASDTIKDVKDQIQDMEGILPKHQRMTYGSKPLKDGKSLEDYEIKNGAVLSIV